MILIMINIQLTNIIINLLITICIHHIIFYIKLISLLFFLRIQNLQKELMEYNILENAIFVPISAKIGTNLNILKEKITEIVLKQKDIENNRYIEEDKRLKLEQEEKINKLKEKRNNENLNINENKIKILNVNGKIINKLNANEKKSIVHTEKEKEEEEDVFNEMYQFQQNSSSAGVLLDIEKSRKLGTTLHVVIRRGEVR